MKTLLFILLFASPVLLSHAQVAMTFDEAKEKGLDMSNLDDEYGSGIHSDKALAVFKDEALYMTAYKEFYKALGRHLKENGFFWDKPAKAFNRIYFDKDGSIDYFIYNFPPEELSSDKITQFGELLQTFVRDHRFPLSAEEKFAQCGSVRYQASAQ